MTALTRLEKATLAMETRAQLMVEAKAEGATWEQIAQAAHMSRAGVILAANAWKAKQ